MVQHFQDSAIPNLPTIIILPGLHTIILLVMLLSESFNSDY